MCEDKNAIRPLSSIRKNNIGSVDVESSLGSAFTCYHICCQHFLYEFFVIFFLTTLGFITVKDSDRLERESEFSTATKEFKANKDGAWLQERVYPSWNGSQVLAGSYFH